MTIQTLKFQSQSVSKLYFIAAMVLFAGQILFGGRTADGEFGRCVGQVAARTKVARDERLSFKP